MNKLFLLGDSTCAIKEEKARPETGWGECFSQYLAAGWTLRNLAKNGRSTESVLLEGIFSDCAHEAGPGDYVIIQFGHNESKPEVHRHTEPYGKYQDNLRYMISRLEKKGAEVVLISSIARRNFIDGKMVDTHGDYPAAMKKVAEEKHLIFIEMSERTRSLLEAMGEEKSRELFMNFDAGLYENYPEGKGDNTHLRPAGAAFIASLIAEECRKVGLPFVKR